MSALLSVSGLSKSFGAVTVADATSFEVASGAAIGILGPNGAGKTSLFNLITGALKPDAGQISFEGADITASSAAQRCKMGISRSFQVPRPLGGMTVFENALVGATQGAGLTGRAALAGSRWLRLAVHAPVSLLLGPRWTDAHLIDAG